MAGISDPETLDKLNEALARWNEESGIKWRSLPSEWLRKNLPNMTQLAVCKALNTCFHNRGKIKLVPEKRDEWKHDHTHHIDFEINFPDCKLYIETILIDQGCEETPQLVIVNMHDSD